MSKPTKHKHEKQFTPCWSSTNTCRMRFERAIPLTILDMEPRPFVQQQTGLAQVHELYNGKTKETKTGKKNSNNTN